MNSPEKNDPIEKLLREQEAYVSDDGFTKRVMTRLPRRRQRRLARVILLAVVVVGAAVAIHFLPWNSLPPLDYTKVYTLDSEVFSAWLPVLAVITALVTAASAALRRED